MKHLIVVLVAIRLLAHLTWFLLALGFQLLIPYRTTIVVFVFFFLYMALFLHRRGYDVNKFVPIIPTPPAQPPELNKISPELLTPHSSSKQALEAFSSNNQRLLKLQPTHRDLLLNQAFVEYYLENESGYQDYLEKAKLVDPNHQVFK